MSSLAVNDTLLVQFVVSATETITNAQYQVAAAGGVPVAGQELVVTYVEPLVANFSAFPRTGTAPLDVLFFNNAGSSPINYWWDFGDGITSTQSSPLHPYTGSKVYTITYMVSNGYLTDTVVRPNYITVTQPVVANFSVVPLLGPVPLAVTFNNNSSNATDFI